MEENFSAQPRRRVAFAWQFPPSAWPSGTAFGEEQGWADRRFQFPLSNANPDQRAELNEELGHNVAYSLESDLVPLSRPSPAAPQPNENRDPGDLISLGAPGPADQPSSWPTWNAEPFSWPDRNSTHQATRYEENPASEWAFNFSREGYRSTNVQETWDTESVHSWRDDPERAPSPNWNAEPPSWAGATSNHQEDEALQMANSPRNNSPTAFLDMYARGRATLTFANDSDEMESIRGLNTKVIRKRCAVLAMAFEDSRSGPQLFLETLTSATALPFLRFLYTGYYSQNGPRDDDVPTSVLFHFKMYHLGDIYDLEALKTQARLNVFRQCEYGCCSPDKPIDLCAAIRWFYRTLGKVDGIFSSKHTVLINTVIDYCVTCFLRHHLGEDAEFKELAYEVRPFQQALCSNIRDRNFDPNETAAAIINLPFRTYAPETYASREDASAQRFDDVIFHFHAHDELDNAGKKRKRKGQIAIAEEQSTELAFRPRVTSVEQSQPVTEPQYVDVSQGGISKRRASCSEDSATAPPLQPSLVPVELLLRRGNRQTSQGGAHPSGVQTATQRLLSNSRHPHHSRGLSDTIPTENVEDGDPASDFEPISPPPKVEALSDSDSEDSFIEIGHRDVKAESSQSPRRAANTAGTASDSDSDGSWEWM